MGIERSANLIDHILNHTDLSQADLARKLKVSRAQVSKWKAGDYLSSERTSELLTLAGLFDTVCVEWAIFAKSAENAQAWYSYVLEILEDVEWGDSLKDFFREMPDIYAGHLITDLCDLGAKIDQPAPATRWVDEDVYEQTPLASVLFSILETWGQLKDWIDNMLDCDDMTSEAECELFDITSDLEWLAFDLSLKHVERTQLTAIGVDEAKLDALVTTSREKVKSYLHDICDIRTKHGLPIAENYFQFLYLPP